MKAGIATGYSVRYTSFALLLLISVCGFSCRRHVAAGHPPCPDYIAADARAVDSAVILLKTGDVVLRRGIGADSYILAAMNKRDQSYSHCGIVIVEHGYPFVYHSIGGEDNPDGRLRRDSAKSFFCPAHNIRIGIVRFKIDTAIVSKLAGAVDNYYAKRPRFDLKFDLESDDRLYCSEFVYKALIKATGDTSYIALSVLHGSRYVGIDDLFLSSHCSLIWQTEFKRYLCPQK